jgi:hypothetical protein
MNSPNEVTPKEISELKSQEKTLYGALPVIIAIILAILSFALKLEIKINVGAILSATIGTLLAWLINGYLKSNKFREFNNKAIDLIKASEYEKAIYQFELGVYLRPKNPALYYNLAWLYSLIENKEKSITHLYNSKRYGLVNLKAKIEKNENFGFVKKTPEFSEFYDNLT